MKKITIGLLIILFLNSCATLIGGARYNANIHVTGAKNPSIYYQGAKIGDGAASIKIKRRDADQVHFVVKQEGDHDQEYFFKQKEIRAGAIFGSIFSGIGFSLENNNFGGTNITLSYSPIWIIIDLLNYSSLWKPDANEPGVFKGNYKNYRYSLNYIATPEKILTPKKEIKSKQDSNLLSQIEYLRELKKLVDEGILTEEEFIYMKKKSMGLDAKLENKEILDLPEKVIKTTEEKPVEIEHKKEEKDITTEEIKVQNPQKEEEAKKKAKQEKLDDLDKMLEFEIIGEEEYNKFKEKILQE